MRARLRNGEISPFQRYLKMGASTADCIQQIAKSIPEVADSLARNFEIAIRLLQQEDACIFLVRVSSKAECICAFVAVKPK